MNNCDFDDVYSSANPLISEVNIFLSGLAVPLTLKAISATISSHQNVVPLTIRPLTTKTVRIFKKSFNYFEDFQASSQNNIIYVSVWCD